MVLGENECRWAALTAQKIESKLNWVSDKNRDKLPYTTAEDGSYDDRSGPDDCSWWTNGFWGGLMWQMYARCREDKYAAYADLAERKLDPCLTDFYGLNHDVGFMWLPTSVANYRVTGNAASRRRALHAATILAGRYNPEGGFIRAWDDLPGEDTRGWAIIDCLMNLPLLYWASEETGDPRFRQIAMRHAMTVKSAFLRPDGSSCHIVEFDPVSGKRLRSHGGQGFGHGSAWTRGQGWAIYGLALSYRYTGERSFLRAAQTAAQYTMAQLPKWNYVPIDFRQPEDCGWEDNCGACVIACGLLELAEQAEDAGFVQQCRNSALSILQTLTGSRCDWSENCDAIVQKCSASYQNGRDITMCYADYFLTEAIFRMDGTALTIF